MCWLEPFKPAWIEEPVPPENLAALKKTAEKVSIPVATGERLHTRYDYRTLFELQTARERARRASLGLEMLARSTQDFKTSPPGAQGLGVLVPPSSR